MKTPARRLTARAVSLLVFCSIGCQSTAGRAVLTPLTLARDVVDVPLVTVTNVFEYWADRSDPIPTPQAGVGVGTGGVSAGIGLNFSYYIFKPFSWVFGAVDYVAGRSFWPNWPKGISPWVGEGQTWGDLYFPSTRELWREATEEEPEDTPEETLDEPDA